jgi:hypothetical protein
MMDPIDVYIGKRLKKFASRQRLPINERSRLLQNALYLSRFGFPKIKTAPRTIYLEWNRSVTLTFVSVDWSRIYSLQPGLFNFRVL